MTNSFYGAVGLVGGTTGMLDDIEGAFLDNNDCAWIIDVANNKFYFYELDADSGLAESLPDIIIPDSNPGTKRWILLYSSDTIGVLAQAAEWTKQQNFTEATITSTSNATAWDLDNAQTAVHVLTENTTISAPSGQNAGGCYVLRVVQAAGIYTLAFNAAITWGAQTAPVAPVADGDVVVFSFYSDGTTMYGVEVVREEA